MRTSIVLTLASVSWAIGAACASTEEQATLSPEPSPSPLDGAAPKEDAVAPDADVPDASLPKCSPDGWCVTPFPDEDLDFRDIWPLEDRAFAIAWSRIEGVKILEWQASTDAWAYIDDRSQNEIGIGTFPGRIYAPNADEVYFTVGPAFVYHGKRPVAPETRWTWTREELPDGVVGHPPDHVHGNPYYNAAREAQITLGVWGTGEDDVYAYYSNTIFRRDPESGAWSPAYVPGDLTETGHVYFLAAAGTGPDDLWFAGAREEPGAVGCAFLVHKTKGAWTVVADGVVKSAYPYACNVKPGTIRIGGQGGGWLTEIQPISATEYGAIQVATKTNGILESAMRTRVRPEDGGYVADQSAIPVKLALDLPRIVRSMWRTDSETWFTSWGLVLRGGDDGTYTVSTISRDGAPVDAPLHRIRGSSNRNLWAIGARHALHKTTP